FGDIPMFDGPINYTGIFLFRKEVPPVDGHFMFHRYKRMGSENDPSFNSAVDSLVSPRPTPIKDVTPIRYSELSLNTWDFQTAETNTRIQQIASSHLTLANYSTAIFQGIASGKDEVFYVSKEQAKDSGLESE